MKRYPPTPNATNNSNCGRNSKILDLYRLDISLESLKKGKMLNPKMELIQADATQLPLRNNYFSNKFKIQFLIAC